MKRRDRVVRRWLAGQALLWGLGGVLLGLLGCFSPQTRLQSEDDNEHDRYGVKTVGDWTLVGNAEPVPVGGVGLVEGLEGTGGESPMDEYRAMLEDQLNKKGVKHIKELLSSPERAVVIVQGRIPAGANKDDPIDVEVILPPRSKATSLRGGMLRPCHLFNYNFAQNLRPDYTGPRGMLLGHPIARAEGAILVGLGDGDEEARLKHGRIWSGGRCLVEQPFGLIMNRDQQFGKSTSLIAERINQTFDGGFRGGVGAIATPEKNLGVYLRVPAQYRLNQPRYLRVVRLIPLNGSGEPTGGQGQDARSYPQRLADDLLDPAHTVVAALRLEAVGEKSKAILKTGLESKHPLVRFCSAEALAYLGSASAGEELARTVIEQPMLRAFALTALASLDEAVSQVKLTELLTSSQDDETRYGAFRALRALDEHNQSVEGELLNESFWLHRVAPHTPPLVHLSSTRRAEIVLFGEEPFLKAPFRFLAGDFTLTATEGDTRCTISRFPLHSSPPPPRQCSLKLADVLHTMAELGALYPEAVALLQQAHRCQCLSCRVRVDALPQATSVYDLVEVGQNKNGPLDGTALVPGGQDLGATPTLYELGMPSHSVLEREQEAMNRDRKVSAAKKERKQLEE